MKSLKISLLVLLFIHISAILSVNILGLNFDITNGAGDKINSLGKTISKQVKSIRYPMVIKYPLGVYSNYSGINKGYEFYSPNVSSMVIDFSFISNGKRIRVPLNSHEATIKFYTASDYLKKNLNNPGLRDKMLKSIGMRIFALQPGLNKIDINLLVTNINSLQEAADVNQRDKTIVIPGFQLIRHL